MQQEPDQLVQVTKEQFDSLERTVGNTAADISYPLSEPREELLEMLLKDDAGGFIDCIVAHFETLSGFIPVMDEIARTCKRVKK
jgi:hypothetical protein